MVALLQAVIFDMDGVIAETEGDGHRVAFNETFRRNEIKAEWDQETYAELLKIPAGKDRLRHYILQNALLPEEGLEDRIIDLLRQKTVIFQDLVKSGQIPARPGVRDFIQSLFKANLKVALATTGSEKAAHTLLNSLLGKQIHNQFTAILAGDMAKKKKPDPEIYALAAEQLRINPGRAFVIEDSRDGLLAGLGAGFNVCITKSAYTKDEDFSGAAFVVDDILSGRITIERFEEYIEKTAETDTED